MSAQEKTERQLKILKGALLEDERSVAYITFKDRMWHLSIMVHSLGGPIHEDLCCHENWDTFIELIIPYSDYVEE